MAPANYLRRLSGALILASLLVLLFVLALGWRYEVRVAYVELQLLEQANENSTSLLGRSLRNQILEKYGREIDVHVRWQSDGRYVWEDGFIANDFAIDSLLYRRYPNRKIDLARATLSELQKAFQLPVWAPNIESKHSKNLKVCLKKLKSRPILVVELQFDPFEDGPRSFKTESGPVSFLEVAGARCGQIGYRLQAYAELYSEFYQLQDNGFAAALTDSFGFPEAPGSLQDATRIAVWESVKDLSHSEASDSLLSQLPLNAKAFDIDVEKSLKFVPLVVPFLFGLLLAAFQSVLDHITAKGLYGEVADEWLGFYSGPGGWAHLISVLVLGPLISIWFYLKTIRLPTWLVIVLCFCALAVSLGTAIKAGSVRVRVLSNRRSSEGNAK